MNFRIIACAIALALSTVSAWAAEPTPHSIDTSITLEGLVSHSHKLSRQESRS